MELTKAEVDTVAKDAPDIAALLRALVKGSQQPLTSLFTKIAETHVLDDCRVVLRTHALNVLPSGLPRTEALAKMVAKRIVDFCIPASEIAEALAQLQKTKSTAAFVELEMKARGLFTELKNTGEGGELLLFMLLEGLLGLPQIFCKMPLKTNKKMHVHGADGIHAHYDNASSKLALYWGESKLHQSFSAAATTCFESLAPFLKADPGGSGDATRDIELISDYLDLNDAELESALLEYLDPEKEAANHVIIRGAALIGFDHSAYATTPSPKTAAQLVARISPDLKTWADKLAQLAESNDIAEVDIETFCIPFASVGELRDAFLTELGLKK